MSTVEVVFTTIILVSLFIGFFTYLNSLRSSLEKVKMNKINANAETIKKRIQVDIDAVNQTSKLEEYKHKNEKMKHDYDLAIRKLEKSHESQLNEMQKIHEKEMESLKADSEIKLKEQENYDPVISRIRVACDLVNKEQSIVAKALKDLQKDTLTIQKTYLEHGYEFDVADLNNALERVTQTIKELNVLTVEDITNIITSNSNVRPSKHIDDMLNGR